MTKFTDKKQIETGDKESPFQESPSPQKVTIDPIIYREAESRVKKRAEKKKQEELEKTAIPQKRPYTVKLEVLAPVELIYRIWAETPEQAVELLRYGVIVKPPKPILSKRKNVKATVYKYGTILIEFIKKYR